MMVVVMEHGDDEMSDGLVQRLYAEYVDDGDCLALEAADRLKQYREALEALSDARSAMDGGSIAECRRIAAQALQVQP